LNRTLRSGVPIVTLYFTNLLEAVLRLSSRFGIALLGLLLLPGAAFAAPMSPEEENAAVDRIIAEAAAHYTEGALAWRASELARAHREWNAAIDVFLEGHVPVSRSEKLQLAYREMVETITDYERGAETAGIDLPEQVYVPSDQEFAKAVGELPPLTIASTELPAASHPQIQAFVYYYTRGRGRATMQQGLVRSAAYRPLAEKIFREEGVPTELVWLAQVESGWHSTALSPVGALGVWQFMPATATRFGLRQTSAYDERMDFAKATRAAARYLKFLAARYDGDWLLAVGAYNCGEGNMDRAIERAGGAKNFWTLRQRGLLPNETANYVPAVMAAALIGSNPSRFEVN
jgi:membrane-bound lytic murein transglycosylase D